MNQLSPEQLELVSSLADRLGAISGVRAVVLGGSHARSKGRPPRGEVWPDRSVGFYRWYMDWLDESLRQLKGRSRRTR